jgi:dephospho-CoA kinase
MQNENQRTLLSVFVRHSAFIVLHLRRCTVLCRHVYNQKPIIGIAGGIGSGKSFVARLFGELGCLVVHADDQVKQAYNDPIILQTLRNWWGPTVFKPDGGIDRPAIARRIFANSADRVKLEQLLHPWVARDRDEIMKRVADDPAIVAFIWDTPLLFETGLEKECDALVYVDADDELRRKRVSDTRNWDQTEIIRREKLQWPLDKKRKMSHYVVVNTADAAKSRSQVREILSRILVN